MSLYFNWSCDFQRFTKSKKLSKFQVRTTTFVLLNKSLSTSLFNLQGTICCFQRVFTTFRCSQPLINSLFSISKPEAFVKNFFRFIFQSIFVHRLDSILTAVETAYSEYQTFHRLSRTFFQILFGTLNRCLKTAYLGYHRSPCFVNNYFSFFCILCKPLRYRRKSAILNILYKDL